MRKRLAFLAYLAGWRLVRALPERVAYALFTAVADLAWRRSGAGVRRLRSNLARAVPAAGPAELDALTRAGMRSYLRYWCDAFRMPGWSRERTIGTIRLEGPGYAPAREAIDAGRGVVCALAHQGNWDHAGAWSTLDWTPVTTVAERLRPEGLFRRFVRYREDLGMRIIALDDDGVFRDLLRTLAAGGFVPLLADRDLTSTGVRVTLLGEPARMAAGPAALAVSSGAALYAVSIWYERLPPGAPARWGIVVHFHPEAVPPPAAPGEAAAGRAARVAAMTQQVADGLSAGIAAHPEDWHMLQRVFEADLTGGRPPSRRAPGQREPAAEAGAAPASGTG
jgi:KDO2-lipid IV(A) lauroyltransferase